MGNYWAPRELCVVVISLQTLSLVPFLKHEGLRSNQEEENLPLKNSL